MASPFLSSDYSIQVDRALIEKGTLYDFVQMAWPEVEPAPLIPNWHLEEICIHLEAVSAVQIRNLVINIPPGCGKSITLNVLWPAWEWIKRPQTKWIFASYDVTLVGARDGGKLLTLLNSEWFQARWGALLTEKSPSASNFSTVGGGFRFSTSPGGKGMGRHPNIIVVDDSIKPQDALGGGSIEKKQLVRVSNWWANTMSSRQADPKTHRNVIMAQRLHRRDLPGEMIDAGYTVLRLPMKYEKNFHCATPVGGDRRTQEGELLFPERYDEEAVAFQEKTMGLVVASAQLQQRPTVEGGGIFKRSDWRFWHYRPDVDEPCLDERCFIAQRCLEPDNPLHARRRKCVVPPSHGLDVQSWDMTFKGKDGTDFVSAGLWRAYLGLYYLLDIENDRMSFTRTKERVKVFSARWPTSYVKLVEDKANGAAIEDELKIDIPGITLVNPLGGKEARANACSPLFAANKVFIPHPDLMPIVWLYMAQLEGFPRDTHDDLVDMTSQALLLFRKHGELFLQAMANVRGEK